MSTPRDEKRHMHPTKALSAEPDCYDEVTIYVSDREVLRSGAGWYVGTTYWGPEFGGHVGPYDRETGYFETKKEAEEVLARMNEEIARNRREFEP